MPEFPTPCTNGQSPPTQGGSSISSFEPAASTLGLVGSIATVGSFCLFCGNGDGPLPVLTSASAANATAGSAPIASTLSMSANPPRFSIRIPPVGASPLRDPTPGTPAVNPSGGVSSQSGSVRETIEGGGELLVRHLEVLEVTREVRRVGRHVEVAVA